MIGEFGSIFEVLFGLNIAYAGSNLFRNAVDNNILEIKNVRSEQIDNKIKESESLLTIFTSGGEIINTRLQEESLKFKSRCDELEKIATERENFVIGFKAMFLSSAIYSLLLLGLGAFEQFIDYTTLSISLMVLHMAFFFNLFVFGRSLFSKHDKTIKPLFTISVFLLLIILCYATRFYCPRTDSLINTFSNRGSLLIAISIASSSYLFHFLRAFCHKRYYRYLVNRAYKEFDKNLSTINNFTRFINSK